MFKKKLPSSVDFMLLGTCNLCCPFCFGPSHKISAIKTDLAIKVVKKLAKNGVERIVFTGGEPTLIKDLPIILKAGKKSGLKTVLSTNGLLLLKNNLLEDIIAHLDWIALPLEGDTPEANAGLRIGLKPKLRIEHFKTVLALISKIKKDYPNLKIKLGTVVTQLNLNHIAGIPKVLASQGTIPDTWKLYQISPSEYGKRNYSWLKVSKEEFERVYKKAETQAKLVSFSNIIRYTNAQRPGKYLFIDPQGQTLVIDQITNDYYSIGNILDNFYEVVNKWQNYIDHDLLKENFERTYP